MMTNLNNANNSHHFQDCHRFQLLILRRNQTTSTQYWWQQRQRKKAEYEHTIQNQARPRIPQARYQAYES
jgi:hypothetical protein